MKKRVLAIALSAVMLLSATACGGNSGASATTAAKQESAAAAETSAAESGSQESTGETGASAHRDTLTVAINSEPGTLNPYDHDITNAFLATSLTYETLIVKDKDGNYQPKLAKEWNWIDDTTVQFKLRDDVTFHDGSKFNAEDVKFCLGLMAESSFTKNFFGHVDLENTTVDDDYTITIKLDQPYAPFEAALASWRGAMISKEAYEKDGADAFGRAPVGTGPMQFKEWVTGDHIAFTANPNYWGDALNYDNLNIRIIVESASRTMELETGGVDIAMNIPTEDCDRVQDNPDLNLISGEGLRFEFLLLNIEDDINKDIRVREAMAHAINYQALVDTVWRGHAKVADSFLPPAVMGYKSVGPYTYDVELSKKLLAEAGYPDGFEFDFITWQNDYNPQVAQVLQSMWAQVGIKMNIQVVDLPSFLTSFNAGELQVTHTGATAAINDPDAALLIWPLWRTIPLRHNDQKIQDFLDKGATTYDKAERTAIYEDMMQYCFDQCYVIPLAYLEFAYGTRADIQNMTFAADNVPDLSVVGFAD